MPVCDYHANYFQMNYPQQGWQCPVCQRVYSPTTPMCWNCPPKQATQTGTTHSCPHINFEQRTDGLYCKDCGGRVEGITP